MYQEYRYWSPLHDSEMARISMTDDRGGEFFAILPAGYGKAYRESRLTAVEAIVTAMRMGMDPGEVRYQ